jgi:hypothetical protein
VTDAREAAEQSQPDEHTTEPSATTPTAPAVEQAPVEQPVSQLSDPAERPVEQPAEQPEQPAAAATPEGAATSEPADNAPTQQAPTEQVPTEPEPTAEPTGEPEDAPAPASLTVPVPAPTHAMVPTPAVTPAALAAAKPAAPAPPAPAASDAVSSQSADVWGRVDDEGTVYVRTADGGERVIGSWAAGSPAEALAYFHRKFEGIRVEVELLEHRVNETDLAPREALAAIEKLRETIVDAHAIGDLAALLARLDALVSVVESQRAKRKAARDQAQAQAKASKERIVSEAESLADSTDWRVAGDRLRDLVEEWKRAPRLDRHADDELWHRFSQARSAFSKRRKAHFAQLDAERGAAKLRKEKLVAEAEQLSGSTDWSTTASRYRELMRDWKAAGRAQRDIDDELWGRFRAAQDAFFNARQSVLNERDEEFRGNLERKEKLLADAERLVPVTDVRAARAALRAIHERWEAIGMAPREARQRLEGGLRAVERAVQDAEQAEWRRTNPEARARAEGTVSQLKASIAQLEQQAEKATAAGNTRKVAEAEAAIAARKEWLAEAEKALAEFTR